MPNCLFVLICIPFQIIALHTSQSGHFCKNLERDNYTPKGYFCHRFYSKIINNETEKIFSMDGRFRCGAPCCLW